MSTSNSHEPIPSAAQLLDLVEGSPAAVAVHDRQAWLALFTPDGTVEDPVGSRKRQGRAELTSFWDAFIGTNAISFDVAHDEIWPRPGGGVVMRDLTLSTTIGGASGTGPTVDAPMHLCYEVATSNNALRISSLRAHWSQPGLASALLRQGRQGLAAGGTMTARMVRELGIQGTLGFTQGSVRPAQLHTHRAVRAVTALGAGELAAAKKLCSALDMRLGDGTKLGPEAVISLMAGTRIGKTIATGRSITMSVHRPHGLGRGVVEYQIPQAGRSSGGRAQAGRSSGGRVAKSSPMLTLYLRPVD